MSFDVITMGRVGVDLYPLQVGVPLERVETFGKFLGGSATNVAVAAARHGRRSAVVTRTGEDAFARFVHLALRDLGVDDRFVTSVPGLPTPVTFCEIFPPDDFPLWFYRTPTAPDLQIAPDELDLDEIRAALAPDLAAIFAEEPWLDLPPSPEAQAKVLSRLECIKPAVFQAALERLSPGSGVQTAALTLTHDEQTGHPPGREAQAPASPGNSPGPKEFLLGVMNDQTIELHLRIEAAKALLPYF